MNRAVVVFARYPRAGLVKTRLAAEVGDEAAAAFYRRCAERVFDSCADNDARRIVSYSDPAELPFMRKWVPAAFDLRAQSEGDLGARMRDAFEALFAEGCDRIVLVGSDVPALRASHITRAWELLDDHDVVLGPSPDGGYYLIALRAPQPSLFSGMTWSTSTVCAHTRERCAAQGLSVAELESLEDVDTSDAAARVVWDA